LGRTGAFAVGGVLLTTVLDTVLVSDHEFCIEKNINIIVATAHDK
jgi:hypothetical protein